MGEVVKGPRNSAIELYRILLMFGIVVLHAAHVSSEAGSFHWLKTGTAWCVDGFVFITGYFGCRFSWKKVLRLYGTALWCGMVIVGIWALIAKYGSLDSAMMEQLGMADFPEWEICDFVKAIIGHINSSWFLHAYVLMMCLVPIVNSIFDHYTTKQIVLMILPFLIAVFGWGLVIGLPILHRYVPKTPGLGSMTGLTLLGCYICGRLYRRFEDWLHFDLKPLFIALTFLLFVDSFGYGWFGCYASPVAVVTAAVTFNLFKRVHLPACLEKWVLLISPSMFAIYILHIYSPCMKLMALGVSCLHGQMPLELVLVIISILVFSSCMLIDSLRRFSLYMLGKVTKHESLR